jgi:hypothetical protein
MNSLCPIRSAIDSLSLCSNGLMWVYVPCPLNFGALKDLIRSLLSLHKVREYV